MPEFTYDIVVIRKDMPVYELIWRLSKALQASDGRATIVDMDGNNLCILVDSKGVKSA